MTYDWSVSGSTYLLYRRSILSKPGRLPLEEGNFLMFYLLISSLIFELQMFRIFLNRNNELLLIVQVQGMKSEQIQENQEQILDSNYVYSHDQQFEVQKILDEDYRDGSIHYLVKWKGFNIAMSTWEEQSKLSHLTHIINKFRKSKSGKYEKNTLQVCNNGINPYRETQIHGHFLYGDQPQKIVNMFLQFDDNEQKVVLLQIQWRPRRVENGWMKLHNSILDSDLVFEHHPQFLVNFYCASLQMSPSE